jgi:hypothetical protein
LKEFHLFGKLAVEIRVKIWHLHIWNSPHIIDIQLGPAVREGREMPTEFMLVGPHAWSQATPRSRVPPAILHVCFEAREEAKKFYKLTNFDYHSEYSGIKGNEIWFNPAVDIVYFGDTTCLATIIYTRKELDIRRIALNSTNRIVQCHDFDEPTYGIEGGIGPMQALHGCHGEEQKRSMYGLYTGLPSIREVSFVVQSNLCRPNVGEINLSYGFRPATTDGLTKGQKSFKSWMMAEIQAIESGVTLYNVGENKWVDDKKPTFHWVSLSLQNGVDGVYYDGLGVDDAAVKFLNRRAHVLDAISKRTECHIRIPNKTFPKEFPREIGFSGTRKAIEEAKAEIIKKIAQSDGSVVPVSSLSD